MGNFFSNLFPILIFCIFPIGLPAWGIYLLRNNKKILKFSGKYFFGLALLGDLIWIYFELHNPKSPFFTKTEMESIQESLFLLMPNAFFYIGVFSFFEKKLWLKIAGAMVALFSFLVFFLFSFVGTP